MTNSRFSRGNATRACGPCIGRRAESKGSGCAGSPNNATRWSVSAPIVEGVGARSSTRQHQEAAGDGDVLHEVDHLHHVARLVVEYDPGEHGEARERDRGIASPQTQKNTKTAA